MAEGARIEVTEHGPYRVTGGLPLQVETIATDDQQESIAWEHGEQVPADQSFDGTETAQRASYEDGAKLYSGPTMDLDDNPVFCSVARFCDARGMVWSNVKRTDTEEGREIVGAEAMMCPSGRLVALDKATGETITMEPDFEGQGIGLIEDPAEDCSGPLWVQGGVEVVGADGEPYEIRNRVTLCRCGLSANKPFCDGTHVQSGWKAD
jgi:CDGSH-type Zn-finger protein